MVWTVYKAGCGCFFPVAASTAKRGALETNGKEYETEEEARAAAQSLNRQQQQREKGGNYGK